jgi:hypothetical protein
VGMIGRIVKRGDQTVVVLDQPTTLPDGTEVEVDLPGPTPLLEELVAGITDHNRHDETEWGPAVGNEAW